MVRVADKGIRDCRDDLLGVEEVREKALRQGRLLERLLMHAEPQAQCVKTCVVTRFCDGWCAEETAASSSESGEAGLARVLSGES